MRFKQKLLLSLLIVLVVLVTNVSVAQAQIGNVSCNDKWHLGCPIIPTACTDACPPECPGNVSDTPCTALHMVSTMVHIAHWILAVVGAVALGYFVYGGFILLTAAGNSGQVDHGRRILLSTVIGLFIVLGAFQLVSWVGTLFGGGTTPEDFNKFLETGPAQCINAGDACSFNNGPRVYACASDGSCSGESLCDYWSAPARAGQRYGLTVDHACRDFNTECSSEYVDNLCGGGENIKCCTPR